MRAVTCSLGLALAAGAALTWALALSTETGDAAAPSSAASVTPAQVPPTPPAPTLDPAAVVEPAASSDWPAIPPGAVPLLDTIHARGREQALVGGALMLHDTTLFSCLYATTDGGLSWSPLGPAVDGGRILAVSADEEQIYAVGHHHELDGGAPFVLASRDGGRNWKREKLDLGPYRDALVTSAVLAPAPSKPVLALELAGVPQRRLWLSWSDEGWQLQRADGGSADSMGTSIGPDGWSWRILDGLIEVRGPEDPFWQPTEGQPEDEVEAASPANFTA